jgi:hypothetical protein
MFKNVKHTNDMHSTITMQVVPNQKHRNKQKEKNLYTGKNKYIQTRTTKKKQTKCLSTPSNLNDTLSPIWQEIHYSGMRNRNMPRPRRPPNLNIKTPVKD